MSLKDRLDAAGNEGLDDAKLSGRCEYTPDGGSFEGVVTEEPLESSDDWRHVFERFNLDPDVFEIVNDTVRISTWQQSRRTDDGNRDVVNLYSYRAVFTRKSAALEQVVIDDLIADIRSWKPAKRTPGSGLGPAVTAWFGNADMQIGKDSNGGTPVTKQEFLEDVEQFAAFVKAQRKVGRNIESIAFANMGDPVEAVDGHYASQTASVDLNQRDQLTTVLELWKVALRELVPLTEGFDFLNVLCNHGEWNRRGGKNFMGDADNASGFLGDTIKMIFEGVKGFEHVRWHLPTDEMITTATLSGINVGAAHGHKIGGNLETWLTRQSQVLRYEHGFTPDLWMLAHKHHAYLQDFGPYHAIQHTTLDGGSKSFTDYTGKWSTPGTTIALIGTHDARGFSNYEVI